MSKRKAATDLNHDNWDREEAPERAGKFREAPKEGEESSETKKIFTGFVGFGNNFGAVNSLANPSSISEIAKNSFSFLKKSDTPLKTVTAEGKSGEKKLSNETDENYLAKLKGLNEAVLDWIKQHVESNPCCILTPIFRDYDDNLKEIQSEKSKSSPTKVQKVNLADFPLQSTDSKPTNTFLLGSSNNADKSAASNAPLFSFGSNDSPKKTSVPSFSFSSKDASSKLLVPSNAENKNTEKTSNPTFSFGSKEPSEKTPPSFLFGASNNDLNKPTPFFGLLKNDKNKSSTDKSNFSNSFPSVQPGGFTFSGLNKPAESSSNVEAEGEEDSEEPQPEPVKPVTEEGAIFTQRVKMFVKKGENYSDLGVGNLFIKEAPNGWHQAIVRHDTSIGNIILNILLSSQQPTKRLGKNNVMIVCQPTPQHTGAAVPVLLRVKTSEDADKLLEIIEKYKKK